MSQSAFLSLCGALSLAIGAAAQTAQSPAPAPGTTIRTSTSEVMLDIVVRDKHGKPVKNLKPGDIEIYEDGARQEVNSFRYSGTREAVTEKKTPSAPVAAAPIHATPPRSLRAVNVLCIVFHNVDPISRPRTTEIVQEFLKTHLEPDTYVGLFRLDDAGLTPLHPFTNDRAELERSLKNVFSLLPVEFASAAEPVLTANPTEVTVDVAISGQGAGTSAETSLRVSGGEVSRRVVTGADVGTSAGSNIMRGVQVTQNRDFGQISGMREYDKINNMIKALSTLPGRKSVLLLSTGYNTTGDPDLMEPMYARANQAGITVYSLDVSPLSISDKAQSADLGVDRIASVSRSQTAINSSLSDMKEKSRQGDTMNMAVRASDGQASLRALAESTGGFLIANTNEFHKPFQRIVEEIDAHYEITYRPPSDKLDGRFRKIAIKTTRADLVAEGRAGYFAMPELKGSSELQPHEVLGLAVLDVKPAPHAFDLDTAEFRFRSDGQNTQGALVFEAPGTALTASARPERGTQVLHASLFALVKDSTGTVVDKYSFDSPYEIPAAKIQMVRATPLMFTHGVRLPAGKYTVESAFMDREGKRSSTNHMEFEIPEGSAALSVSSPMLLRSTEPVQGAPDASDPLIFRGQRLIPFTDLNLPADASPKLYFVVYPDKSKTEKPKLQVEFLVDGQVLANQTADLPAPDATGAIPMVIKAATHPGTCEIKITVLQGSESAAGSVTYKITSPGSAAR
jgi:VWFA-related protein